MLRLQLLECREYLLCRANNLHACVVVLFKARDVTPGGRKTKPRAWAKRIVSGPDVGRQCNPTTTFSPKRHNLRGGW